MGYYASSGEEVLTEDCPAGAHFLARFQVEGEAATAPASEAGIRVVHLRIPPVIGGPSLRQPVFQAGNGQQWMSWIGRDELALIVAFALTSESLSGPVNAVSPNPLRNAEFARISRKNSGTKRGATMPAFLARLILGEMGEEFLLASRRIQPAKLLAAGYQFCFPDLADALCHEQERLHASPASSQTPTLWT
jgi:NAD dependent epimerase/dehydratase family enzyme